VSFIAKVTNAHGGESSISILYPLLSDIGSIPGAFRPLGRARQSRSLQQSRSRSRTRQSSQPRLRFRVRRALPTRIRQADDFVSSAKLAPGTPIEVWCQDEMRVGQKNKLTYRWARMKVGQKNKLHLSLGQKRLTPPCHPRSTYRIDSASSCRSRWCSVTHG
jgi:hypothetical protein